MPKIKNYTRKKSKEKKQIPYHWDHDKINFSVEVQRSAIGRGKWAVATSPEGTNAYSSRKKFDDKESAREWAVKWMRSHPKD